MWSWDGVREISERRESSSNQALGSKGFELSAERCFSSQVDWITLVADYSMTPAGADTLDAELDDLMAHVWADSKALPVVVDRGRVTTSMARSGADSESFALTRYGRRCSDDLCGG